MNEWIFVFDPFLCHGCFFLRQRFIKRWIECVLFLDASPEKNVHAHFLVVTFGNKCSVVLEHTVMLFWCETAEMLCKTVALNLFRVLDPLHIFWNPEDPWPPIQARSKMYSLFIYFPSCCCVFVSPGPESVWLVSETNSRFSHFSMLQSCSLWSFSFSLNNGSCHLLLVFVCLFVN